MQELHARFKGRVQGVGFRWTVQDVAERFGLTGTVRNCADGTVEVYAQGDQCDAFLKALQEDAGGAHIERVEISYREGKTSYPDFRIVY